MSSLGSLNTDKLSLNSSQAPLGGLTATTDPSFLLSLCGRCSDKHKSPPTTMMAMKVMYTDRGTPAVVLESRLMMTGMIPPITEPSACMFMSIVA